MSKVGVRLIGVRIEEEGGPLVREDQRLEALLAARAPLVRVVHPRELQVLLLPLALVRRPELVLLDERLELRPGLSAFMFLIERKQGGSKAGLVFYDWEEEQSCAARGTHDERKKGPLLPASS